ncbi:MAG: AI-2E family transporter [Gemmatimonas sp.]
MTDTRPALFWIAVAVVLAILIYLLSAVLLPFVAGSLVAYFLNPAAEWLEKHGLPRWAAATVTLVVFLVAVIAMLMLVVPALTSQAAALVQNLPGIVRGIRERVIEWMPSLQEQFGGSIDEIAGKAASAAGDLAGILVGLAGRVVAGGFAVLNALSLLFIMPVVAFYILRDWPKIVATVDSWLPRPVVPTVRGLVSDMDSIVAGFVRGVGLVCLIQAVYYAAALTLVGLPFGLAIGLFAGFATFIPFVGGLVSFVLALFLAISHFSTWTPVFLVIAVFAIGQFSEGYLLTPRLVGNRVGLHPVWVIFALMAGGALFGFLGILLAVPAGAAIGVLTRFAVLRYRESPYFQGSAQP